MSKIKIEGGRPLQGEILVQGSKNGALPILAATVLSGRKILLKNCPMISDVEDMLTILSSLGCSVHREETDIYVDASCINSCVVSKALAEKMRSSILLLGALLGRLGEACIPYPGGCVIGARPVDLHLSGLAQMGISICEEDTFIQGKGKPLGGKVNLPMSSVGATENLLLAAAGAKGLTVLSGCAKEPEIIALCEFLKCIGVGIEGIGTADIIVRPPKKFQDAQYIIPGDRIVAGTYVLAAAATGGQISLTGVDEIGWRGQLYPYSMLNLQTDYEESSKTLRVKAPKKLHNIVFLDTAPYPGFPTDLQSQMLAVLTCAEGVSFLQENIFEQRFKIIDELVKMGASVQKERNIVMIKGVSCLKGTNLTTRELRGGAALVIAALMAHGTSEITGVSYIERGYEDICRDLQMLGGNIEYEKG